MIVNFNTRDYLRGCLTSLFRSQGSFSWEVCVVDNASTDGSVDMVRREFPQVEVVVSDVNGGYAYANNLGLRRYGFGTDERPGGGQEPRFALLLNPDTVVPPDSLATMISFMEEHPDAGAAGPKLVLENGQLDLACRRSFPTPEISFYRMVGLSRLFPRHRRFGRYNLTYLDPSQTVEVESVVGAFMLVRGQAIMQAGLLDETFFMYGEDLDWAYRIVKCGWKVFYCADTTVLHVKKAASRHSRKAQREFYRAMRVFYYKHYAATTPRWLHLLVVGGINARASLLEIGKWWSQTTGRSNGKLNGRATAGER